jgi:HK97 family phage major capsid protein
MTLAELREKRAKAVAEARALVNKVDGESRQFSKEEEEQYDRMMADVDGLKAQIDRVEKLERSEGDLAAEGGRASLPLGATPRGHDGAIDGRVRDAQVRSDYRRWLLTGEVRDSLRPDQARLGEYRDSILGTDAKGGFLVTPTQISDDVVKVAQDQLWLWDLIGWYIVTEAKALGVRKMTAHMGDSNWTTEVQAVTEDTTMAFDRRDLTPYLLSKLSKASINLLYRSADAEAVINEDLAYKFAVTLEKGFMTGTGSSQPLGVFTASASGISTGRDVSTGNSTTAIAADNLFEVQGSINAAYLNSPKVGWVFHRDAVKQIRKLKDSQNRYLWEPSMQAGKPDVLLGAPVYQTEYAPNTFTTGLYVGLFGNLSYYRAARVKDLVIQRLVELYAGTNEVGFIGRMWADGAPILEQAFARVKLA